MYRERSALPAHRALLRCVWQDELPLGDAALVVPDACMDLVFDGYTLKVAGPDTRPVREHAAVPRTFVGVRFHVGLGASLLDVPASALRDARVPLVTLWGDPARKLEDALRAAEPHVRASLLEAALGSERVRMRRDRLVQALVQQLAGEAPQASVASLAHALGVSERQLHRRCVEAVGYGPKLLARVLRMQSFQRLVRRAPLVPLATLAAQLGYVDQAHLSHDCRALCGRSPAQLRAEAMSEIDKTASAPVAQAVRHATPL